MLTYVIDAYNVLHRITSLRGKLKKDFSGARDVFLLKLSAFVLRGSRKVVVVFDGSGANAEAGAGNLRIVYADPGKSADLKIKQIIDQGRNPRNLVVVSSDAEVARYGRLNACRLLSAEEFIGLLDRDRNRGGSEKPSNISESEKEELLRLFQSKKE